MAATDYNNMLVRRQFMADEKFANPNEPGLAPHIGALAMVAAEQGANKINTEFNTEKLQEVELHYKELDCDATVSDASTSCDIDGVEPQTQKKTYSLNRRRQPAGLKLNMRKFETSMHEADEMFAGDSLLKQKLLLEDLNKRVHAVLDTTANKTDISDAGYGGLSDLVDSTSKDILIHPSEFTPGGVFPIFWEVASRVGMVDPVLLTGGAMARMLYDLLKDKKPGEVARHNDFRIYMDYSMDTTLGVEKVFMVEKGVLAILNRPDWFNRTPKLVADDRRVWSRDVVVADTVQSKFAIGTGLNGKAVTLQMDVEHQLGCNSRTEPLEFTRYILNADIVRTPDSDCSATAIGGNPYTGIVGFTVGIPEES